MGSWKWTCWGGAVKREIQIYKTSKKTGKSRGRSPRGCCAESIEIQAAGAIEKIIRRFNTSGRCFWNILTWFQTTSEAFPSVPTRAKKRLSSGFKMQWNYFQYLQSLCLLWTRPFTRMRRSVLKVSPKMYGHTRGYHPNSKTDGCSLPDPWSIVESGTIGWAANSVGTGWKGMSMQGSFKSPLNPKWVVLSLWVTVQSPGIRTEVLRRTGSPDATFSVPGPIHPQN